MITLTRSPSTQSGEAPPGSWWTACAAYGERVVYVKCPECERVAQIHRALTDGQTALDCAACPFISFVRLAGWP